MIKQLPITHNISKLIPQASSYLIRNRFQTLIFSYFLIKEYRKRFSLFDSELVYRKRFSLFDSELV